MMVFVVSATMEKGWVSIQQVINTTGVNTGSIYVQNLSDGVEKLKLMLLL